MSLLEVQDLTTQFQTKKGVVTAVDGVSFELEEGEAIGLVGESGCGKTTTALSITRLLPDNGRVIGGSVRMDGKDLLSLSENQMRRHRWNDIAIAFQGAMNALNPVMKVGDQVIESIMYHHGKSYAAARKRTKELFELVEIDPKRIDQYPHEFSGGMKQRAMIAMSLACDPKILIGDEPTTALDVMVQAQILDLLERLRKELKMAMILITHDLSVMSDTCDKAAVMYGGKIVEIGSVQQIIENGTHPYTKKLISSFPNMKGKRVLPESIPGTPPDLSEPPSGCYFHDRCAFAEERCRSAIPKLEMVGAGHFAACHRKEELA
ncbi:ABC transporter ATP-binding protein [Falsibacillus albus]|uniref:ABC transporter ATP-binding protein n=1 Tax=Falsibacillus albus TaxID=2478915 RepID=A0A3L7JVA9_9BACI|nr:ABC transporter ATP-binding protein [Falsibacillus albus]RLQ94787.1 ABC transporter ATP-binding protein [Falsibacillus albus]